MSMTSGGGACRNSTAIFHCRRVRPELAFCRRNCPLQNGPRRARSRSAYAHVAQKRDPNAPGVHHRTRPPPLRLTGALLLCVSRTSREIRSRTPALRKRSAAATRRRPAGSGTLENLPHSACPGGAAHEMRRALLMSAATGRNPCVMLVGDQTALTASTALTARRGQQPRLRPGRHGPEGATIPTA